MKHATWPKPNKIEQNRIKRYMGGVSLDLNLTHNHKPRHTRLLKAPRPPKPWRRRISIRVHWRAFLFTEQNWTFGLWTQSDSQDLSTKPAKIFGPVQFRGLHRKWADPTGSFWKKLEIVWFGIVVPTTYDGASSNLPVFTRCHRSL
jgi:hypothetical protein